MGKNEVISLPDDVENALKEKFLPKKKQGLELAKIYKELRFENREQRVADCGNILDFAPAPAVPEGEQKEKSKLYYANFCKDRLCPMCGWRKSLKVGAELAEVVTELREYEFIFITLTIINPSAEQLNNQLNKMQKAFHRMINKKFWKQAILGFFKSLEITYNKEENTYHPHYHLLCCVKKGYFKSDEYIKQPDLLQAWQQAMNDDRITQVNIKKVTNNKKKGSKNELDVLAAVVETAKYSVKSSDYLKHSPEVNKMVTLTLAGALAGRRLYSFSGLMKEVAERLEQKKKNEPKAEAPATLLRVRYNNKTQKYDKYEYIKNVRRSDVIVNVEDDYDEFPDLPPPHIRI